MGSNPITDYLQRMINRRIAGQYSPQTPEDNGPGLASSLGSAAGQVLGGAAGMMADPLGLTPANPNGLAQGGPTLAPWVRQLPQTLESLSINPLSPVPVLPGPGMPPPAPKPPRSLALGHRSGLNTYTKPPEPKFAPPDVSTKLDPLGKLSFSLNGGALQLYDPSKAGGINPTPELSSQLAQTRARGFMGQPGQVSFPSSGAGPDFQQGPGYSPSQQDWSKVANPMAFEGYREQPEVADIERYLQDPLWREKQTASIEQQKQVAIAQAQAQAQASMLAQAAEKQRNDIDQLAKTWIDQENKTRQASNKPPLTLQEQQAYYQMAQQRYSGKYGLV